MKAKDLAKILLENPEMEVCIPNGNDSGYDVVYGADKITVVKTPDKKNWQGDYQNYNFPDQGAETIVLAIG